MIRYFIFLLMLTSFSPDRLIAQEVQISGFSNVGFGTWSGGDILATDTVCAYRSSGGRTYTITPSGDGAGNAFELRNGSNTIPFHFRWRKLGSNFETHTANQTLPHGGADKKNTDCGGSDNAEMEISLQFADLDAAVPGNYSGTVTIVVGSP